MAKEATAKTAETLAKEQRAISVSEFFEKNRHLLGFDNPTKALLTVVKEAVDNSLDACEEARILPDVKVIIKPLEENVFRVTIEDNGPGIVKQQIPHIFARLLYGSKFGRGKQSRGQQGIGISAAVLYSQLTTGKPAIIYSKPDKNKKTHMVELKLDTTKNEPKILKEEDLEDGLKHTGTKIILEIQGKYIQSKHSVDEYMRQTAIMNPHANIRYENAAGEKSDWKRTVDKLPPLPKEIKPHPHGVEMGILERMAHNTDSRTVANFMQNDFCRVGSTSAEEMCRLAGIAPNAKPRELTSEQVRKLYDAIQKVKLMRPPTDCLAPIGEKMLEEGLKNETKAEFVNAVTRDPVVYRGNPFQIEAAIAYGGDLAKTQSGEVASDEAVQQPAKLIRYANKMPLLYEQSSCALTKAVQGVTWRRYGMNQPGGGLPHGPAVIAVHICSTWVPYTSEGKEAIASYPEIIEEIKLAVQEVARSLFQYVSGIRKTEDRAKRQKLFEVYIPELAGDLAHLTGEKKEKMEEGLKKFLKKNVAKIIEEGGDNGEAAKE
ncbi:MAG: DNA topoisomerase VI subunit B [Candidatus Aenigmatarchaeota archaeon]|nr:MAG: DNA topoisomerase VI subunit B [Candidatus Aenigmarchaeota archaeon]